MGFRLSAANIDGDFEARTGAVVLAVFLLAAAATVWMSAQMQVGMPMPGGWEMSMAWMPMDGAGWVSATLMFLLMWLLMMVAMMLPSALPVLLLYRRLLRFRAEADAGSRVGCLAAGYFATWSGFGLLAWGGGVGITQWAMASATVSRAVPLMAAVALLIAGVWQWLPWKSACLAHCRDPLAEVSRHAGSGALGAWRLGIRHGAWCAGCCWGIMLVQLAFGVMSLSLMLLLSGWIALEKLSRWGPALVRPGGALAVLVGLALVARALNA